MISCLSFSSFYSIGSVFSSQKNDGDDGERVGSQVRYDISKDMSCRKQAGKVATKEHISGVTDGEGEIPYHSYHLHCGFLNVQINRQTG